MSRSPAVTGQVLEDSGDPWIHLHDWTNDMGCPSQAVGKMIQCVKHGQTFPTAGTLDANRILNWHCIAKFKIVGDAEKIESKKGNITGYEHCAEFPIEILQPESLPKAPENAKKYNHYFVRVPWSHIDIYRLLELFKVTDNAIGHAVKKLLVPGLRGSKATKQDIIEARDTLNRRIEMWDEDESVKDDML